MKKITDKNLFWLVESLKIGHLTTATVDGVSAKPYLCGYWEEKVWYWPATLVTTGQSKLDKKICKKCLKIANSS